MSVRKYTFLLSSCIAALAIGEIVVRVIYPTLGWGLMRDDRLGWASYEYLSIDPGKADPSKKKYLFLGDSFLAGAGLRSLRDRFPDRFGALMGDSAEVYTFASGGWGTDQQYLALLQKGLALKPDVVVLAYCSLNDLDNITSSSHGGDLHKPYFMLKDGRLSFYDRNGLPASTESVREGKPAGHRNPALRCYLWNFLRWKLRLIPEAGKATSVSPFAAESPEHLRYREKLFRAILLEMQQACNRIGASFYVLSLPVREGGMPPPGPGGYGGIPLIDVTPAFPGLSGASILHRKIWPPDNEHFSAEGHRIIAGLLRDKFSPRR